MGFEKLITIGSLLYYFVEFRNLLLLKLFEFETADEKYNTKKVFFEIKKTLKLDHKNDYIITIMNKSSKVY